ncbi:hypothetical protein D3C81_1082480 [compost metagenome]
MHPCHARRRQDRVQVVVAPAGLTVDVHRLFEQRLRQAQGHGAVDLGFNDRRVDDAAWVDRLPDVVHLDLTVVDRHLGDHRRLRAERRGHGHAARPFAAVLGRERPALPATGQFAHRLQQVRQARVVAQQMQAQFIGVLAALVRQFVEECFVEEVVQRIAHRTPVAKHGRAFDIDLGDAFIGDGVRFARQPLKGGGVDLVTLLAGQCLGRAFGGAHGFNGHGQAIGIQRGAELDHGQWAQHVTQELFLAAPDQFDRAADSLGQGDGLRVGVGRVVQKVPAKEAAQQGRVQGDAGGVEAGAFGDVVAEHVRGLVGQPHLQ